MPGLPNQLRFGPVYGLEHNPVALQRSPAWMNADPVRGQFLDLEEGKNEREKEDENDQVPAADVENPDGEGATSGGSDQAVNGDPGCVIS